MESYWANASDEKKKRKNSPVIYFFVAGIIQNVLFIVLLR
jgi:hypothetical protein